MKRAFNAAIFWVLPLIASMFFCSESPFDSTTSLGATIIDDIDPTVNDIQGSFKTALLGIPVDSAFSMVNSKIPNADSAKNFSERVHPRTGRIFVGNVGNQVRLGYIEFDGPTFLARYDSARTHNCNGELTLKLPRDSTFDRSDSILVSIAAMEKSSGEDIDTTGAETVSLGNKFANDSILVISLSAARIATVMRTRITDSTKANIPLFLRSNTALTAFAGATLDFSIGSTSDFCKKQAKAFGASYYDYTVYELDSSALDDSAIAISSSGREAIMELDLTPIWDVLEDTSSGKTYTNILQAFLRIQNVNPDLGNDSMYQLRLYLLDTIPGMIKKQEYPSSITRDSLQGSIIDSLEIQQLLNQYLVKGAEKPQTGYLLFELLRPGDFSSVFFDIKDAILQLTILFSNAE